MSIHVAQTDADIDACWPVMSQLRPHIARADFLPRVRRQQAAGYQLAALSDAGRVVALAGFRYGEILAWGPHMYVDDLITDETARSLGHGEQLFAWLVEQARAHGCEQLHLDSGVQRFGAHRFYLRQRMDITSHHFALKLHGTAAP